MTTRFFIRLAAFAGVLVVLLAVYVPTLQTIPNGSDHYYMIDVGETQIVLNVWGTLHYTGYPLYVMTGNVLVSVIRALGASAALAPALVSLAWGLAALGLMYLLALHLTGRVVLAAGVVLVYGLTRTVWIHSVIAEIYSFGLMLLVAMLLVALWRGRIRGRVLWLALLGGVGVAHHRALAMAAPALVFAARREIVGDRRLLGRLAACVLLGLVGFIPYVYLPLRAQAGAAWVYGEPGTLLGFWEQFTAVEASRFIGLPRTAEALRANLDVVNAVLVTDLTLPGLVLGLVGLGAGVRSRRHRHAALTLVISGGVAYGFHAALYTDILSALILPITLSVAFGWLFGLDVAAGEHAARLQNTTPPPPPSPNSGRGWRDRSFGQGQASRVVVSIGIGAVCAVGAWGLVSQNAGFIDGLTDDTTGLETIALARETPPGATLMLAWGHRHFAVGFARDVLGELPDIRLVDHSADFAAIAAEGMLVTPEYTFYNLPLSWWEARLGRRVYLTAVAPHLVRIGTEAERVEIAALGAVNESVHCADEAIVLDVTWASPDVLARDLSVFVHLLDAGGAVIAQADQSAPVYGWRPLTTWDAGEAVRDVYALPRIANAASIAYGLYYQTDIGEFVNAIEARVTVMCDG